MKEIKCTCGNKSKKQTEVISKGIIQIVHWHGDYIVKEQTSYDKTTKNSTYFCEDCGGIL
jgi:hypothetical protein